MKSNDYFAGNILKKKDSKNPVRDEYAHLIAELTTDYIYRMKISGDGALEVAYVSPEFIRVIGYTAEEIESAEAWNRIVYPEDIHSLEKFFTEIMSGNPADLKYRLITKDGGIRWVHNYSQPIYDDDSEGIIGIIGAASDITETMRVQEAYQVLVNNSLQGLAIIQDLQIIFVNDVIANISGYSKEELLQFDAQKIQEVIHPDDQERILRRLSGLSAGEEASRREEYRLIKKDGNECWVETYASPIQYQEKRAVQIAFNEITEQKKGELKLSEAKNNLERMLSSSPAVIYNLQLFGNIPTTYISSNVMNELGYKPEEFYSDQGFWRNRVHPDDLENMPLDPSKMIEAKEMYEYRFKHADGSYHWIQDKRRVIKTGDNEPDEIVGYLIDITERKKMEDKIRRISSRLETILQNMPAGVLVEDEDGYIILSNDSFCDMFGIQAGPESLVGLHCLTAAEGAKEYFQNEKEFIHEINELITVKELKTQQELHLKDGRVFERDYIPIREDGEYRGHLWQYKDITERKQNELKLEKKSNFEQLISRLSTGFINLNVEHVDVAIYNTLQQIVEFLEADRGYVFQKDPDSQTLRLTHDWCKKGLPSLLGNMGEIEFPQMEYGYEKLTQFEPLIITPDFDYSLLSGPEKMLIEKYQMKSLILVPMVAGGEVKGILGLDSTKKSLQATTQTISLLRLAADMLQNTLERKSFIQRIKKSEAISRAVLSSLAAHISVLDKDGTINAINNSWRQHAKENGDPDLSSTGVGVNYFDVIDNVNDDPERDYAQQVASGIKSVLQREEKHFTVEYPLNLEDSVKWYLLSATPLMDASGGAVISHLDITERKNAEETLRESEEKFRTLAENLPDTIHIYDIQKQEVVFTNRPEFLGYTPEQLGNFEFLETIVHPEDWELLEAGIQSIFDKKIPPSIEFRIQAATGQWEWIQKKISPFTIKDGEITHILSVDTIISERKWSEEIIRESEEKFRNIVEQSSDAIILTDKVGDVIQWNSAAENIFDLS
ncbi:MAG: PAS domain S-box protein, partial [Candidatus Marinimicrobia bacterium]|nr:PAS domain S-box protein [Candidatus Neomarinimicrobiota bacterium]